MNILIDLIEGVKEENNPSLLAILVFKKRKKSAFIQKKSK